MEAGNPLLGVANTPERRELVHRVSVADTAAVTSLDYRPKGARVHLPGLSNTNNNVKHGRTSCNFGAPFCKSLAKKMERAKGFEPSTQKSEPAQLQSPPQSASEGYTQIRAQISGPVDSDLAQVVEAWRSLSQPLKAAILAIVNSAAENEEGRP